MQRVLCLLYHRVNPVKDEVFHLTVSPEHFEEQIRYLKDQFPLYRFEEDWGEKERDGVVLTFDDGYADNYEYALPILEKYQVPAAVFVASGYVNGTEEYWWDELSRVLTREREYPKRFELQDSLYQYTWETDSLEKRLDLIRSLHWLLKLEPEVERGNSWLMQLRNWAGISSGGREEHLPVSIEMLRRLNASEVITIGGHTVNHRSLGVQTKESQAYEIGASVKFLEQELGQNIEVFSYPFGSSVHFNEDTFAVCREKGIKKAASTVKGLWKKGTPSYEVPRMEAGDWGGKEFEEFIRECWRYSR